MLSLSAHQLDTIRALLLQAGQRAREASAQAFEVFEKGYDDYVTTVDRELDQQLSVTFARLFPDDGIVTEENRTSAAAFAGSYRRLWFIDPIDGTEDFIHHKPHYALMVGLLMNERPRAGWIYGPAHDRFYWGGPDWGLFQCGDNGAAQPLQPRCPPLSAQGKCPLLLGSRDQRRFGAAIAQWAPRLQPYELGSFGLKVMEVIKGQAGLYVYLNGRVKLWDTTGPLALALAAGLTCCDLDGQPLRFDATSVYPDSLIHRQPILIGWPNYIDCFREPLRQAVMMVRSQEL